MAESHIDKREIRPMLRRERRGFRRVEGDADGVVPCVGDDLFQMKRDERFVFDN